MLECGVENGFLTRVAGQGDDLAAKFKTLSEKSMTLDQLAEAQRLAGSGGRRAYNNLLNLLKMGLKHSLLKNY